MTPAARTQALSPSPTYHTLNKSSKEIKEWFEDHLFFLRTIPCDPQLLQKLSQQWIFSVSGWRGLVEEKPLSTLSSKPFFFDPQLAYFSMLVARTFCQFLKQKSSLTRIALGCDSRPTGPSLTLFSLIALSAEVQVDYLGILPINELVSYCHASFSGEGFLYISASHNPVEYNGFKMGLSTQGVLSEQLVKVPYRIMQETLHSTQLQQELQSLLYHPHLFMIQQFLEEEKLYRKQSMEDYTTLSNSLLQRKDLPTTRISADPVLPLNLPHLGVLGELNGSARATSIDQQFFTRYGLLYQKHHALPGHFVHQILPEGPGLALAQQLLNRAHQQDPRWQIAYVPDCDGDRGNILLHRGETVQVLEAQRLFQLVVLSELCVAAFLLTRKTLKKLAIICNDATSFCIEELAHEFGVSCWRSEVGEANLLSLSQTLSQQGYRTLIIGEGSNGGCIIPPSQVRDPLHMLTSLVRLLSLPWSFREFPQSLKALYKACNHSPGTQQLQSTPPSSLTAFLSLIPHYETTEVSSDPLAQLPLKGSLCDLKRHYHQNFSRDWENPCSFLHRLLKVQSYQEWQYNQDHSTLDPINTLCNEALNTGSYQIRLFDGKQQVIGFCWFRPSGTEPVLRLMVDLHFANAKCQKAYQIFFHYHRNLIIQSMK